MTLACSENIMNKNCHVKCVKSISRLNQTLFYYSIIRSQKISTGSGYYNPTATELADLLD